MTDATNRPRVSDPAPPARRRLLLRGGTIISMDPTVGNIARGDVLIGGDRISAVGAELLAGDAPVLDASDTTVMPGMIDTHRHA